MGTIFDRVSAMPADKRDALTQQFDKASRLAAAEPVAVVRRPLFGHWKRPTSGVSSWTNTP
jgi:hypothetical protein